MIPYKDDIKSETVPYVTYFLIAANIVIFAFLYLNPGSYAPILKAYGAIPRNIIRGISGTYHISPYLTIITAMFLHGNVPHLLFNMIFLWIFGNNVEDRLGHASYALFYTMGGYTATIAHALLNPLSANTVIGASGAVSAILGAYVILYPKAKVHTFFLIYRIPVPAAIFIGLWAVINIISGINASLLGQSGVAWFAHLGGFAFGLAAIKWWPSRHRQKETKKHAQKTAPHKLATKYSHGGKR